MHRFLRQLGWLIRRKRKEAELQEEMEFHLEAEAEEREAYGAPGDQARSIARRQFGNVARLKEDTRSMWGWTLVRQLGQDVRYAWRIMRRTPVFTAVVVSSLALVIGANTAIFSLVHTLMLKPLPVRSPEQLVELLSVYPGDPRVSTFSLEYYEYLRERNTVFSDLIGVSGPVRLLVEGEGLETETITGQWVMGDVFPALGVRPAIGRMIGPEDDRPDAAAVAVLSEAYWRRRFDRDPAILGRRIVVNGSPATVVGVAPPEFFGLQVGFRTDVWAPMAMALAAGGPNASLALMGRLKEGVSLPQARAELSVLDQSRIDRWAEQSDDPLIRQVTLDVEPAGAGFGSLRDPYAGPLLGLMAAAGLLLAVACANVAAMLLARGSARQREMALRISLGAGRFRLVRQALTESLLLSAAGALAGGWLAYLGAGVLVRILASGRPLVGWPGPIEIQILPDVPVLLFTAGAAVLTGVAFGLAPVWNALAAAPVSALRETGRAGETRARKRLGQGLVVAQMALSVALVSAAGLFILHLEHLRNRDLGFQRDAVLLVKLDSARGRDERSLRSYEVLLERMKAIPGARSATLLGPSPISGGAASRFVEVEGLDEAPADRRRVLLAWVAPEYFETLGTPLVAGRDFERADEGRPRVAIVNRAMGRRYFGGGGPLGRRLTLEGGDVAYEIVGLAEDAKYMELREPAPPTIYLHAFQEPFIYTDEIALRADVAPVSLIEEARRVAGDVLPSVRVTQVTTLSEQMDASIVPERMIATLSGLFGALAALLAAVGLYGLLAYAVSRRTGEIGLRMALGATRRGVVGMVLQESLALAALGLLAGVPLALGGRRLAAGVLDGLPVGSPLPIAFAGAAMIAVAFVAAWAPARRAARVEPMEALRHD